MEFVDCVYRVHEEGEILQGAYDIQKGVLRGRPELFQIDLSDKYEFIDTMYHGVDIRRKDIITMNQLVCMMCRKPGSLMVINYNNIGVIIVYRDHVTHKIFNRMHVDTECFVISDPVQLKDVRVLGVMRSKIKTLSVVQPYFKIIGVRGVDNVERVYTQEGVYELEEGLSPYVGLDVPAYKNMLKDDFPVFGLVNVKGKSYYLKLQNNKLQYSKEGGIDYGN